MGKEANQEIDIHSDLNEGKGANVQGREGEAE